VLQCVAVRCSVLQCVAVCCSELQWVVVCYSVLQHSAKVESKSHRLLHCGLQSGEWRGGGGDDTHIHRTHTTAHTTHNTVNLTRSPYRPPTFWWNAVQHIATRCNTRQHTETHCSTLQHTAAHCNIQTPLFHSKPTEPHDRPIGDVK